MTMCNNLQPNCNSYKQEKNIKNKKIKIKNQNRPMEKPYFNKDMKCKCDVTKPKLVTTTTMKASVITINVPTNA